ncbi:MAG: Holliday junction branch migration protein RuvA [Chloroflexi bacterium]|nr:Holliday junction branch migration protein RuvA [Chloroflexota bacterium]
MISSIRGTVASKTGEYVVVEVGGIGFKILAPTSTLDGLGAVGEPVTLMTHLHVREDNLSLFGFVSDQERRMFELLLNVSGVGPKAALNILSATPLESLYTAIASGNSDILTRIPGIGAKTAGRIVLDLKGKIDPRHATSRPADVASADADVLAALTNLGYSLVEAQSAVRALPNEGVLSAEDKIVQALRYFAEQRG